MTRPSLWIALSLPVIAAVAAFGFHRLPGEMRDFEVYWTAAARALDAEPLYRPADGHYQFKYLPAFAVLSAPVALLPLAAAKAAWFVLSAALLPLLIWLAIGILPARRRSAPVLTVVLVVAMAKFYGHELVLGQVNLLFAVVAAAGILMMRHGRDAAAAGLFIAAVAVKPYALLLLPWLVVVRGRTAAITAAAGLVAVLVLPAVHYGVEGAIDLHREWWTTAAGSTAPNLTNNDNVSIAGMSAKWLGAGRTAATVAVISGVALAAVAVLTIMRRRGLEHAEALEGAMLLTLIPLLSPQGWDYAFLVATPAIALLANHDDRLPGWLRALTWAAVATIGLSLYDLMGRERYAAFMSWSVITVCFLVVVAALVSLRLRRVA